MRWLPRLLAPVIFCALVLPAQTAAPTDWTAPLARESEPSANLRGAPC